MSPDRVGSEVVNRHGQRFLGPTPRSIELKLREQLQRSAEQLDLSPPQHAPFSFQQAPLEGDRPANRARSRSSPRQPRSRSPHRQVSRPAQQPPRRSGSPRRQSPSPRRRSPSPGRGRLYPPNRGSRSHWEDPYHSERRSSWHSPPPPIFHRPSLRPTYRPRSRSPHYRHPSPAFRRFSTPPPYSHRPPRSPSPVIPHQPGHSAEALREAVEAAIQPLQQSFAALHQREQERSLPAIQRPAFAAVFSSLRLLPEAVQEQLQPFYLALRAADSVDSEERAIGSLESLTRFCLEHPAASAHDLRQQVQLYAAGSHVNPLLGLLANNQSLLSLIAQPQQPPRTAATPSSNALCYKCGNKGHLAGSCTASRDKLGDPVEFGQLKFAPESWKNAYGFTQDGFKRK